MPYTKIDLTEQVQNDLPAAQVATSSDRQFLTSEQKGAATREATSSQSGLMTAAFAGKLDQIDDQANKYTHPSSHSATMITQDSTHRFVTDTEKSEWDNKLDKSGTKTFSGDLTISGDLTVQGSTVTMNTETIEVEDNVILLNKNQTGIPSTSLQSGVEVERGDKPNALVVFDEDGEEWKVSSDGGTSHTAIAKENDSRFLSAGEKTAATREANSSQSGLMSAAFADKLDKVDDQANNYSLPAATISVRGGVTIGSNLSLSGDEISVPDGSESAKGVLKVGTNLSVSSGVISAPVATKTSKGVVQIGNNISVTGGTISVADGTPTTKGVLRVGSNIAVDSGMISVANADVSTKGVAKLMQTEAFTGDGATDEFSLSAPIGASLYLAVYLNGLRQWEGAGEDYTRDTVSDSVTFLKTPKLGDRIVIDYIPA